MSGQYSRQHSAVPGLILDFSSLCDPELVPAGGWGVAAFDANSLSSGGSLHEDDIAGPPSPMPAYCQPVFPSGWQYASLPLMVHFAAATLNLRSPGVPKASLMLDNE